MSDVMWFVILGVLNIPLYLFLGKIFFNGWEGFGEAIMYWFKPDLWSWMSGEGFEDMMAEIKLAIFFAVCALVVYGEFQLVSGFID